MFMRKVCDVMGSSGEGSIMSEGSVVILALARASLTVGASDFMVVVWSVP